MKHEYDFSQAERGKFYHPNAQFHIPVYLEPDIADFLQQLADKKEVDVTTVVNGWLRKDMELIQLAS
jgi:hypothetical protein